MEKIPTRLRLPPPRPRGRRSPAPSTPLAASLPDLSDVSLPSVYEHWLETLVAADLPADLRPTLRQALLTYALVAAEVVRIACDQDAASFPWCWPNQAPATDWLEDLLRTSRLERFRSEVRELYTQWLDGPLADPMEPLYEALLAPPVRKRLGEVYTPDWLADQVIALAGESLSSTEASAARWLDPTVGSGSMLFALARRTPLERPLPHFVGLDRNPWAILAAAANFAFIGRWRDQQSGRSQRSPLALPFALVDLLADISADQEQPTSPVDILIGNPPWILWDQLPEDQRSRGSELWNHYSLLAERGMRSILGGGKKDLAMLMVPRAADTLLKPNGRLAMVIPLSLLRSSSSGRGLRRWQLPDGIPVGVQRVDDFAAVKVFRTASVKAGIVVLQKNQPTEYPVPYFVWDTEKPGSDLVATQHRGMPSDPDDSLSGWRTIPADSSAALNVDSVCGPSDYSAHLGVNTGGANGIFWLERLEQNGDGLWTMRNLPHHGKKTVPERTMKLEPRWLYPLLTAADVRPWSVKPPSKWILMVQDPDKRRGLSECELAELAPESWDYLYSFQEQLKQRRAYLRYFTRQNRDGTTRETGPFYSMFDVGPYSMSPFKVVWNRMGNQLAAAVVGSAEGRLIQPQETVAFIAAQTEAEGDYLALLLNSPPVRQVLVQHGGVGTKSFATPRIVDQIRIRRFEAGDPLHQKLANLGRTLRLQSEATQATSNQKNRNNGIMSESQQHAMDELTAEYWQLRPGSGVEPFAPS